SRGRANITIALGDKEIAGEVIRGAVPTTSPSAQPTQTPSPSAQPTQTPSPSPSATKSNSNEYTLDQVKARNSATSCWSVIDGYVYDLTNWIASHPGGPAAIRSLCGIDGTTAFLAQHEGQKNPINRLAIYRLGPLKK
ncbi:MAG: cytochrome b5 domain-containing protein, partial [Candidatus Nanopelagicaceae bacterium]